jgi:hypothetical protein
MRRSKSVSKFVQCLRNKDCDDLEPCKLYLVIADDRDLLAIELPKAAEKALLSAA